MKKLLFIFLLAVVLLEINSCEKDNSNNTVFVNLSIDSVDMPDTFFLGATYEIRATYTRPDGCTFLEGFNVAPTDQTTREVYAIGIKYENRPCTEIVTRETNVFYFQVIYRGTYTFKFYQGEDADGNSQFLVREVPVI